MKGLAAVAVFLIVIAVGAYFVLNNYRKPSNLQEINSTPASAPLPSLEVPDNPNLKTFTVEGSNFAFSQSAINVKKGDVVKIVFKVSQGMHDLVVDGYDVSTRVINAGETDTIEFTADREGTFEYYCSLSNHRALGMKGELTVE